MATLLQLPPEQGGFAFGPFEGIVQLGTDARRTQIQLDPRNGIYPVHATLALSGKGPHQFAPAQMEAKCFVAQAGNAAVWPVTGPVQVNPGDSLILGTPGGPRFVLVESVATVPTSTARSGIAGVGALSALSKMLEPRQRSGQRSLGQGIADEFMRRGQANLFRQGPLREVYYLWHRARTGSLINPYTIVSALIAGFGILSAGTVSCIGGLIGLWARLF
jgi:hypothetical protein